MIPSEDIIKYNFEVKERERQDEQYLLLNFSFTQHVRIDSKFGTERKVYLVYLLNLNCVRVRLALDGHGMVCVSDVP